MSNLDINCPHCQQELEIPPEMFGDNFDCPSCNGHIQLRQRQPKLKPRAPNKFTSILKQKSEQAIKPSEPPSLPAEPSSKTKSCPFCGEEILSIAVKCKHCHSDLYGKDELVLTKPTPLNMPAQPGTNALSVIIIVILVILGMFWLTIGLLQVYLNNTSHTVWMYGIANILISIWNLSLIGSIVKRKKSVVNGLLFLGVAGSLFGIGQMLLSNVWLQIIRKRPRVDLLPRPAAA